MVRKQPIRNIPVLQGKTRSKNKGAASTAPFSSPSRMQGRLEVEFCNDGDDSRARLELRLAGG